MNRKSIAIICILSLVSGGWIFSGLISAASASVTNLDAPQDPPAGTVFLPLALYQPGVQAPDLKWQQGGCFSSWCQTGWYSSPAVANIDGDPQAEILAGSYDLIALDGLSVGRGRWIFVESIMNVYHPG